MAEERAKAPPEHTGQEPTPIGYQVTQAPQQTMNMNTNHDKVMVVGATQDGALVMVPENQTTEVQLESEKSPIVTYSQILRGNKEGMDKTRVNQNQGGQQDQAQLEYQDQQVK